MGSNAQNAPAHGRDRENAGDENDGELEARLPNKKRKDLVENEIFHRATALFAERGFAGTSLQDIADAMGMTRPALYYYVKNKDEILSKLVTEITEAPAARLTEINADKSTPPLERLRAMARHVARQNADEPQRFRLITRSESDLPDDLAAIHRRGRRKVLSEFVLVVEEAIASGDVRPVDARVAALGVLGLCNWVAFWHHAKDGYTTDGIADLLADMAVASLAQPVHRRAATVADAIELLREDLDVLEHAASGIRGPARETVDAAKKKRKKLA